MLPKLDELSRRRLPWAIGSQVGPMPPDVVRELAARLLTLLRAEKKAQLQVILVKALAGDGGPEAAAELRKVKLTGVRPEVREETLRAMEGRSGSK